MEQKIKTIDIADIEILNKDYESALPISAMLAKSTVPYSHRRIADSYVVIQKIYGFQISQPRITNSERNLLYKYHFNTLENTTIGQVNIELALLKKWSTSTNDILRNDADKLLEIRVKELKFIISNKYATTTNEVFNGYKAVELYLTEVTKYYSSY